MDCLFCKIVAGEVPSESVYEDDAVLAFRDINPQAPTHILVIPKDHVASAAELEDRHADDLVAIFKAAATIAASEGIAETGYRLITNIGREAGQTVFHLHFHLIGGRPLGWPPG